MRAGTGALHRAGTLDDEPMLPSAALARRALVKTRAMAPCGPPRVAAIASMALLRQRIDKPDLCPSAQVLEGAREYGGFFKYAMAISEQHKQSLLKQPLEGETLERFEVAARDSLALQQRIEETDQGSFEEYVERYYA